jgi:hypothetical protein
VSQRSADLTGANQGNLVTRHGNLSFEPEGEEGGMLEVVVIPFDGAVQVRPSSIVGHAVISISGSMPPWTVSS